MDRECILIEDLESVLEWHGDDPRRAHLETCPRCHARWASLRLFQDPSSSQTGTDIDDADARLGAQIARLAPRRSRLAPRELWWGLAAAAALLLLFGLPAREPTPTPSSVLRGEGSLAPTLPVGEAQWTENGLLSLRWPAHPETGNAEVVFTSIGLEELARIPADAPGRLDLRGEQVPAPLRSGEVLLWSVVLPGEGEDQALTASALIQP